MLAVGIDPGTAITGYGVVLLKEDHSLEVVEFGVIRTSAESQMPERLGKLHRELGKIVAEHQPESAAVEKLFFQKNVKTAIAVGQARGVALLTLGESQIPVHEYSPPEIKQAVAGYGGAEKGQVQRMVQQLLNLAEPPSPDDAADALAVAICHLHSLRYRERIEQQE